MRRFSSIIAAGFTGLIVSGCASSLSTTAKPAATNLTPPPATQTANSTPPPCDARQLQDVLAGLRQSGTIDAEAEDQLTDDLRQCDPSLWPLAIEQVRAAQAYRLQARRRNQVPELVRRLPPTNDVALAPTEGPQDVYPSTSAPPYEATQASYAAPTEGDWRQRLNGAIEALENQTPLDPTTPVELAQHARLRLLYAAAGRRADAVRPIPDATPATQQFLAKELEGLCTWLDAEQVPDPVRRAAEAKPALTEALAKLGETAPLLVRNAAFCSEVLSFGCLKRFDKTEFCRDQEVLLYAEVENFSSEPTEKGFHTSLRSGYEILDDLGHQVLKHDFAATEEYCKSVRHDFFITYRLRIPKQMALGKYLLRLLILDMKRQAIGQASIEFTVKEGKAESAKEKTEGGKGKGEGGKERGDGGRGKGEKELKTQAVAACNQDSKATSV